MENTQVERERGVQGNKLQDKTGRNQWSSSIPGKTQIPEGTG